MTEQTAKALISEFGSPLYLFHEKEFADNYRDIVNTFRSVYPKYNISYSYKTNYTPYICRKVKEYGGLAEVVSDMEYELARRLGYDPEQIVYNGPAKGPFMEEHLLAGGISNIDNYREAQRVCRLAERHPDREIPVGLRVNLDLGRKLFSRFGIEAEGEAMDAVTALLKSKPNIRLRGLHCHISHARDTEAWAGRAEIMLRAADRLFPGGAPEYISLGSGMFGRMEPEFAAQFPGPIPDYADYAECVIRPIAEHYAALPEEAKPRLFTEPGATLVSKYISFLTRVDDIKTVQGRRVAVTDGSFYNLGEICRNKQLPLQRIAVGESAQEYDPVDIAGYTCLEYDFLYKGYRGPLAVGDYLLLGNVGGYSIVSKPQFIRPNCAMAAITEDGAAKRIMRAESFLDVFSKFDF